jgi:hypothetical protein
MSWEISLRDAVSGDHVLVAPFLGGTTRTDHRLAEIGVTFNLLERLEAAGVYPYSLDGLSGAEALPRLAAASVVLGTDRDSDPWANTPGNAGWICGLLAEWARQHPEAVFLVL